MKTSEDVREKVVARMDTIDQLDAETKKLVHEYGWNIVKSFRDAGVVSPSKIRSLVRVVIYEISTVTNAEIARVRRNMESKENA